MTTVLVVAAHPDDAEISMGMRIHDYARQGAQVRVHCLTTGTRPGPTADQRRLECLNAGEILGVHEYTFSDIPDTRFTEARTLINSELFTLLERVRPDIVYTHYPDDQHLDHQVTAQEVTAVALRTANDLTYFRSPYSLGFEPTEIFAATFELLEVKDAALRSFASQSQLDMEVFNTLNQVAFRQHVHHRIVERFPGGHACAELFRIARRIEFSRFKSHRRPNHGEPPECG